MNIRESTEEGIFSRITLDFDTNLVGLKPEVLRYEKPEVLRYEIIDKDNLIS